MELLNDRNGVVISEAGRLEVLAAHKIGDTIVTDGEFSFEVWAKAADAPQISLGTLPSYSDGLAERNFALGPSRTNLFMSLKTTAGNLSGASLSTSSARFSPRRCSIG